MFPLKVLLGFAVLVNLLSQLQVDSTSVQGLIREGIADGVRAFHDDRLPSNKLSSNGHAF
jgi:hypothetical protein